MEEKEKKKQQAVALSYDLEQQTPKIVAVGSGELAQKIIQEAKNNDIPVHRDDKLANTLSKLEIGELIPPELYEIVAEILVFVDGVDKIKAKMQEYEANKR